MMTGPPDMWPYGALSKDTLECRSEVDYPNLTGGKAHPILLGGAMRMHHVATREPAFRG